MSGPSRVPIGRSAGVEGNGGPEPGSALTLLVEAVIDGDRTALARALTLVERGGADAHLVGTLTYPRSGAAHTIGITGAPGAGKSTLTSAMCAEYRRDGRRVGVLAVDPSSPLTGGAILGDRVRMTEHATDPGVFVRSLATRGHLGGLAAATWLAAEVIDVAGFDPVLIETVGVGQSEVDIAGAADTTVVVVNPGWGDAVQANKAGLLEIADVLVVNKADRPGATETSSDLKRMLTLTNRAGWVPPVISASAVTGAGVVEVVDACAQHLTFLRHGDRLAQRRDRRVERRFRVHVDDAVARRARALVEGPEGRRLLDEVRAQGLDPWSAAERLVD